jgi:hypothetical protein
MSPKLAALAIALTIGLSSLEERRRVIPAPRW